MPHSAFDLSNVDPADKVVVENALNNQAEFSYFTDLGASGLRRTSGVLDEEFLPALRGRKAVKVYREMAANHHVVGSLLFSFVQLLKSVNWTVEADDTSDEQVEAKEFLQEVMEDMSHSWDDLIGDILTCLTYGWSYFEITYKQRRGPWEKESKYKSKFTDGKVGWRKIQLRSQETLHRWVFDEEGDVKGMLQMAPPKWKQAYIPIEKALLFRYGSNKSSPEGVSLLRNIYPLYYACKRLLEFTLIGVERDLAGMPVAKVPASYMDAKPGSKERKVFEAFKKMVSNVRRDEHDGMVLPVQYDRNTKQPLFDFELMSSGGTRQFDVVGLIDKLETGMLSTVLADFIKVGHTGTGSYSLHVDKTGIFRQGLSSIADSIADVFNRHAIPRLFEINGMKLDKLPRLVPEAVDPPALDQLTQFMSGMAQMGMEWFPDADLEEYLRKVAHLPEMPQDVLEARRAMSQQHHATSFLQSGIELQGTHQQAGMVEEGMSPVQAEQHLSTPAPETFETQMQQQGVQQQQQMQMQTAQQEQQMSMQMQQQEQQAQMQRAQQQEQRAMQQEDNQLQMENYPVQLQMQKDQLELQHAQLDLKERELGIKNKQKAPQQSDNAEVAADEEDALDPETRAILARLLG